MQTEHMPARRAALMCQPGIVGREPIGRRLPLVGAYGSPTVRQPQFRAPVAAMAAPELSRGTASTQPSVMGASASSRERAIMGIGRS